MKLANGHQIITLPSIVIFIFSLIISYLNLSFWWSILITGLILIFVIQFFRDPDRHIVETNSSAIVSPADGVIFEIDTETFPNTTIFRIRMRFWDVHVNRMPLSGKMIKKEKFRGIFLPILPGLNKISKSKNARQELHFENPDKIPFKVIQISGFLAFRCVSYFPVSEEVTPRGKRLGMIRFGSETDFHIPTKNVDPIVTVGEKVRAGMTIFGNLRK